MGRILEQGYRARHGVEAAAARGENLVAGPDRLLERGADLTFALRREFALFDGPRTAVDRDSDRRFSRDYGLFSGRGHDDCSSEQAYEHYGERCSLRLHARSPLLQQGTW